MKYSSRELAGSIDGTAERERGERERLASSIDQLGQPVGHLDMAEVNARFREAQEAAIVHGLDGEEVPEALRPYAQVNAAVNTYAAAIRHARPLTTDDAQAVWEARNRRSELIAKHQYRQHTMERVLKAVAEDLDAAARAMSTSAATESTRTARLRGRQGGAVHPYKR